MILNIDSVPFGSIAADPSDTTCINEPVQFSGSAVSSVSTWEWDFGDGNTAIGQNVIHTYTAPATYQVSLITTSSLGCSDTSYFQKIITNPNIGFTMSPNPACIVDTVSLMVRGYCQLCTLGMGFWRREYRYRTPNLPCLQYSGALHGYPECVFQVCV